jgi:hypothetical protein
MILSRSVRLGLLVLAFAALAVPACGSSETAPPADDAGTSTPTDARAATDTGTAPPASSEPPKDAAVPPPGPTELPAFEGAFVFFANGGPFFGVKEVAKDVDTDSSKIAANVYTGYFNDSGARFVITLPARTPATLDLSATAKVEVSLPRGADRTTGELSNGKLEIVEATDKKLKARFYGETSGVKVHGAVDATLVP